MIGRLILLVLLLPTIDAFAQMPDWKLQKDRKGIQVFTRLEPGQKFKSTKAIAEIDASLEVILEVLFDYSRYTEWSPACLEARTVSKNQQADGTGTVVSYTLNNAPWPVSNRDIIVHNTITKQSDGSILVKMRAIDSEEPKPRDAVRMNYFEGHWILTPMANGKTHAEYQAVFDPEGSVPAWVINMAVEDTPYDLLKSLREQTAKY